MFDAIIDCITRHVHTFGSQKAGVNYELSPNLIDEDSFPVDDDELETPAFLRRLSSFGELICGDVE